MLLWKLGGLVKEFVAHTLIYDGKILKKNSQVTLLPPEVTIMKPGI